MKLLANALEEDRRAKCEEYSRATGTKTSQENALELASVARGWTTHAPSQRSPHIADVVTKKLLHYGWEVLPHAPYSPDMSPSDLDLFLKLR